MSFLQPHLLWALPLIALPILIHLINQRRYQTIQWAAMLFLLAANRMSRGYARIRQWLILAARTLAVAGLIFAVSRPLTSGWLSLAVGSRPDTTLILVDRSPSMQQSSATGESKLESGLQQILASLRLLGGQHWVLIDSAHPEPVETGSLEDLSGHISSTGVGSSADLPEMLQAARQYLIDHQAGQSDIWICSDVRENDWDSNSGRWRALRDEFLRLPQPVRFHLLAFPEMAPTNRGIRVNEVRRVEGENKAELLLSFRVFQEEPVSAPVEIPVQLDVDGARSELTVQLQSDEVEIVNHVVPIESKQQRGWGKVSLPADANPADNEFYFVYSRAAARHTVIVAEDADVAGPLELAASISPDPETECTVETVFPKQLESVSWETTSLLLWQGPLPEGNAAELVQQFLKRGGQVLFFPPRVTNDATFAGLRWTEWTPLKNPLAVTTWMSDQDLLARTNSGDPLPVGELRVFRRCGLTGEMIPLAQLGDGSPMLARAVNEQRNLYFCSTTPKETDSSLAQDGVVFYVMIQRLLAAGSDSLKSARQLTAGESVWGTDAPWRQLEGDPNAISTDYSQFSGVYKSGDQLLAVNRGEEEDRSGVVADDRVEELFQGLDFDRVDQLAGSGHPLLSEIWRVFLGLMMFALLAEAILCIPRLSGRSSIGHRAGSVVPGPERTAA